MDRFIVVDGHSQVYRACFAGTQNLTGPTGEPTTGPYYFTRMLLKLVREQRPDYMVVASDAPKKTLKRREWDPAYKANRPTHRDPDLSTQIERIYEIIRVLGLPILQVEGWEADDVIATLADTCASEEVEVVIVSRDKDLHQLVSDNPLVRLYDPMDERWWGRKEVMEKWHVEPYRVAYIQALMGDPTDGFPGVKGIGGVFALKLIQQYGDLPSIWENRHKLKGAQRKAIEAANLPHCLRMVQLNREVPLDIGPEQLEFDGLDMEAAAPIFEELGFQRWS